MQWSKAWRYQRENQSLYIEDKQCNGLKLEDTKGVTRTCKSMKDRQYNGLRLEDTKGVTRIRKSKKNRQHNDKKITKG